MYERPRGFDPKGRSILEGYFSELRPFLHIREPRPNQVVLDYTQDLLLCHPGSANGLAYSNRIQVFVRLRYQRAEIERIVDAQALIPDDEVVVMPGSFDLNRDLASFGWIALIRMWQWRRLFV